MPAFKFKYGINMKPIFSMRQVVFIGFSFGFLGTGLALRSSLRHLGKKELGKKMVHLGLLFSVVEALLFALLPIHPAVHFLICGAAGKLAYDRWLMRPAIAYKNQGGTDGDIFQTIFFSVILTAAWLALITLFFLVEYLVDGTTPAILS